MGKSEMDLLTKEASQKSEARTSANTADAISSQESQDGNLRSTSQAGRQKSLFGLDPAHASPSPQRESGKRMKTKDISGQPGFDLSKFADHQLFLANKCRELLGSGGSTEYSMIWKRKATPAGRLYYQLAVSGHPISDKGFGGWHTPAANEDNKSVAAHLAMKKRMGIRDGSHANRTAITSLQVMAKTAGWPSPMAGTPKAEQYNEAGNTDSSRKTIALMAGWQTPKTPSGGGKEERTTSGGGLRKLEDQVLKAGWATPSASEDCHSGSTEHLRKRFMHSRGKRLEQETTYYLNSGLIRNGSTAKTQNTEGYLLNPRFSLYLQGYPEEWAFCAERAIASFRKSRRSLSKR